MIHIDQKSKTPLYLQIYEQIIEEIVDGTLKEQDVLAGSRELAKTLQVSRNTVNNAYGQLAAEGYIYSRKGVGYAVAKLPVLKHIPKNKIQQKKDWNDNTIDQAMDQTYGQGKDRILNQYHIGEHDMKYDLTNSSYTSDLFPKNMWRKYTLEGLDLLEREEKISAFLDKQGEYELRHHLKLYLERIRGVHCDERQIVITAGIQQSLEYICCLLNENRTKVYMEEPGYHKAAVVFAHNHMMIQSIKVDQEGLCTKELPEDSQAAAVYVTPSHQFPTGGTMPISRRIELLEWADRNGAYVLEDDFDSELRYYAKPIPSLQSIDSGEHVVYLGTFSKAMSPSVRMGYMILPPQLLSSYFEKYSDYNSTVPLLNQYVIARLLETGEYDRHIRRLNHVFRRRLECFQEEFADMKDQISITGNGTGQFFLLEFSAQINQKKMIELALKRGVRVYSTMQFWQEKAACPPNTLFLGFSKIDLKDITDCVARLKDAWKNILI